MNAREQVLARVRAALAAAPPGPAPVPRDYRRTGETDPDRLAARFAERVSDYRASVHHGLAAVPGLLAGTATLVVPADLPPRWYAGYPGRVLRDPVTDAGGTAPVPVADLDAPGLSVLTGCAVAIAETGTIVLDTGPAQGRRALSLVPDHHLCVVHAGQIVATVPEALGRLPDPRRPLTFISGPSATSDIELNRVEGVHGPRRLDVVLLAGR